MSELKITISHAISEIIRLPPLQKPMKSGAVSISIKEMYLLRSGTRSLVDLNVGVRINSHLNKRRNT
jgi:hypothetical protein